MLTFFYIFSRNQFSHLPSFLGQLKSLEVLIVSNNRLVSLPEEIGHLSSLMEMVSTHTLHTDTATACTLHSDSATACILHSASATACTLHTVSATDNAKYNFHPYRSRDIYTNVLNQCWLYSSRTVSKCVSTRAGGNYSLFLLPVYIYYSYRSLSSQGTEI